MKQIKKWSSALSLAGMLLFASSPVQANESCPYPSENGTCYYTGGCGYEECRRAPSLAPAVALGTIAVVAIVAVVLQNSSSGSGHSSAHSS